jgi:Flp pilus assembly protein TadB
MVAYILLGLSSIAFGWFVRDMALLALARFSRYQQTVRLKNLVGQSRKSMPFQTVIAFMESNMQMFSKSKMIESYFKYLSRQLLRMNRRDLKPAQVLGYQILASAFAFLFFEILSDIPELAFLAFLTGAGLPLLWIRDQVTRREKLILRDLPNALEILSLCSEAGLSLEQALDQYLKNAKKGPLRDELGGILEQTRSGSNRKDAFESVSSRLDLTDFSLFTTNLIQAERFGTGIAKTLRQLSITIRDKQSQRAEKAVQELPVKMLFPLILFIMPVTFLIIFGPIVLQFFKP